jgi:hypothetical protein
MITPPDGPRRVPAEPQAGERYMEQSLGARALWDVLCCNARTGGGGFVSDVIGRRLREPDARLLAFGGPAVNALAELVAALTEVATLRAQQYRLAAQDLPDAARLEGEVAEALARLENAQAAAKAATAELTCPPPA